MEEPERTVASILTAFAEETGLEPGRPPRRYLWTDAFAVCGFLELHRRTGEPRYREQALRLVDQVHEVLGRHRPDAGRTGWLSGLPEAEGREHPTAGGLRIGKPFPERAPDEPFDERLEWDRDGQYFHYLTKWMHALMRVAQVCDEPRHLRHALELARSAHRGFVHEAGPDRRKVLFWKMSSDLSRPLVPSMGQHDPLDGWVTCEALLAAADASGAAFDPALLSDVRAAIADFEAMCASLQWETADPLGVGGLLTDAWRVAQLVAGGRSDRAGLLEHLLAAARVSLQAAMEQGGWTLPAAHRLAFRELGLAIGLRAAQPLRALLAGGLPEAAQHALSKRSLARADELAGQAPVADAITAFWLEPAHQQVASWRDHLDINRVMLATALAPETYLAIR